MVNLGIEGVDDSKLKVLDVNAIMKTLPHRFPMLLIDRLYIVDRERAVGIKNVTINEDFFNGHFPGHPIMPGVMIIEAMAQTAGALVMENIGSETKGEKVVYFMSIEEGKFRRPVVPGDRVYMHVTCIKNRSNIWKFKGEAKVEGKIVAESVFTAMIVDK